MKQPVQTTNPNQGEILSIAGGSYRIIIAGEQTGGEFAVVEMTVPPGAGPNPHSHDGFTETFYVLEGEVHFKSESGTYTAQKGAFVTIPKGGIVHGFKNLSNSTARLLCTVMPAGLEGFFQEAASIAMDAEGRVEKIKVLSEKYGQQLYPENYLDQ